MAMRGIDGQLVQRWLQNESAARLARVMLVTVGVAIAVLTLYPFDFSFTADHWAHVLVWHRGEKIFDLFVNLLLFCPFGGVGFYALRRPFGAVRASMLTVLMGLCLSLAIEILQAFDRGRDSSANDVVLNMISAGLGLWIAGTVEAGLEFWQRRA